MENNENKKGFLGLFPQWVDLFILCLCIFGFVWLQWWALPRQPAFLIFIISLESIVFLLSFFFPAWGLFLTILTLPGITTSSLTVFNKINPKITIGVFGPAALIPALAFVFGVWLRTSLRKEDLQPNLLRTPLNIFMGLTILSAAVTLWRYSGLNLFNGWNTIDHVVNIDGLTASTAKQNIIWTLTNYLTGPLLFLALCQASWLKIKKNENIWRGWLLKYIFAPFFIGSVAPLVVGFIQRKDVWFGAHKFYIWPWMNRINATFFDPNALGSYLILAVPMVFAAIILLISLSRWLILPAIALGGGFVYYYMIFIGSSGSRMSIAGIVLFLFFALTIFLVKQVEKLKSKISLPKYRILCSFFFALYISIVFFAVFSIPNIIHSVKNNPKLSKTTLGHRLVKMDVKSMADIYINIKKDRGVYAKIAAKMMNELPLTGIGLGSFITELPNYRKLTKELIYVPDNACNYYLQIGAEQGLITLAVVFLIFGIWFKKWWRVMHKAGLFTYWIFIGSGIAAMLIVFLFGMHTLAHEIQCLFWICLAQPFVVSPEKWHFETKSKYLSLFIFIICIIYFSVTISKLSLEKQKKRFGWNDKSHFYQWEKWPDPNVKRVRYSKKDSSEEVNCEGIFFKQKYCALHPDIEKNPVSVLFKLGNYITNIIVKNNDWHSMKIQVDPKLQNKDIDFSVNVSRTWKASTLGMNNDKRKLGLLLNKMSWKKYKGMYKQEKWQDDGSFMSNKKYRWTGKNAELSTTLTGKYVKIPLRIGQPDVVTVNIGINNTNLEELIIANNAWQETTLFCGHFFQTNEKKKAVIIDFSVDKTMSPENFGISDGRELGIAVGNPVSISDFGFYNKEKWNDDFDYRWAGKNARWAEQSDSNGIINILYLVSNPEITNNPVKISFFVNGKKYKTEIINDPNWKLIELQTETNSWNDIRAEVDKTWKPEKYGINDNRILGFAIKLNKKIILNPKKQKNKSGLDDHLQFYQWEKWPDPNVKRVRYSKKDSSEEVNCEGIFFKQKYCALHPDIEKNPVSVLFKLGNYITNIIVKNNDWHSMKIQVDPKLQNKDIDFSVNVSRTWKASTLGMNNDKRKLGLLLNKMSWKKYKGMYKQEKWQDDGSFMSNKKYRWTGKNAELSTTLTGKYVKIPLRIGQPDVVTVNIGINNTNLEELIIANNAWQETTLFCGHFFQTNEKKKAVIIDFSVDKTMSPENFGISDGRELGIAVGNPVSISDFGFYNKEKWNDDFDYRWAGKNARWAEQSDSNGIINILYLVSNPEITNNPVKISFFVNGKKYKTEIINDPNWKLIELQTETNSWNDIRAEVDKTWKPEKYGINDPRELGFAIKCKKYK